MLPLSKLLGDQQFIVEAVPAVRPLASQAEIDLGVINCCRVITACMPALSVVEIDCLGGVSIVESTLLNDSYSLHSTHWQPSLSSTI